jgi:probable DNA metabolism protein
LRVPENFQYYLSMHESCSLPLLYRAERLTAEDVELSQDLETVRIRKMVKSVLAEIYRMRGFVRLKPLGSQILYGYLKPRHKTGSEICRFFSRRSPFTIIVLGNSLESWISLCTGGDVLLANGVALEQTLEELKCALGNAERDDGIEETWKVYYSSQNSPERRNLTAFNRRMPKLSLNSAGLDVENNKNGLTLNDFFGSVGEDERL